MQIHLLDKMAKTSLPDEVQVQRWHSGILCLNQEIYSGRRKQEAIAPAEGKKDVFIVK